MHTTPLLSERDTDLRRAIHAVDPADVTTVPNPSSAGTQPHVPPYVLGHNDRARRTPRE